MSPRRRRALALALLGTLAVLAALAGFLRPRPVPRVSGPFPQEAYVWQRAWTPAVAAAVSGHTSGLTRLVVLAAEVRWDRGEPQVTRADLPHDLLRATGRPLGLALRIGTFPGPFAADDARARALVTLAGSLMREAASNGVAVSEFQVDFDCAETKLDGYARWVGALRQAVAPCPLVLTALPAWLKRPAMGPLVRAADGFVLQVHSLERPSGAGAPLVLCDPAAARSAVERAARLGRPFRVALPTYGYQAGFGADGRFLGLAAEGPAPGWPAGATVREVRADPAAMADLIQAWTQARPHGMEGVIWYRLPVAGDRMNWAMRTLEVVMAGRVPQAELHAQVRRPQPGLVEVDLSNVGTADHTGPVRIDLRWTGGRRLASDALGGFDLAEDGAGLRCQSGPGFHRLRAGEIRTVCWVRLDQEREVILELH
ncbi:MAG: hypothetical protein RJA22_2529 [Verrucomicrobiota bacterium]|jgi:hypothetical protein